MVRLKYADLSKSCLHFEAEFVNIRDIVMPSGKDEDGRIDDAKTSYFCKHGKTFLDVEVWKFFREQPKWIKPGDIPLGYATGWKGANTEDCLPLPKRPAGGIKKSRAVQKELKENEEGITASMVAESKREDVKRHKLELQIGFLEQDKKHALIAIEQYNDNLLARDLSNMSPETVEYLRIRRDALKRANKK